MQYAGRVTIGTVIGAGGYVLFYRPGSIVLLERGDDLEQRIGNENLEVIPRLSGLTVSSPVVIGSWRPMS